MWSVCRRGSCSSIRAGNTATSVIPPGVTARVAVEAASTFGWERYAGSGGAIIGMRTFGVSAPLKDLKRKFGFEPAHVVRAAREQIAGQSPVRGR